jgi:hypothetical protein
MGVKRSSTANATPRARHPRTNHLATGMLTRPIARKYAELVEQHRSRLPFRLVVPLIDHPEVLPLRLVSQTQLSLKFCAGVGLHPTCLDGLLSGYILDGAIRRIAFRQKMRYRFAPPG